MGQPDVNDDGTLIAFASDSRNLNGGGGDPNEGQDIFLRHRGDPAPS